MSMVFLWFLILSCLYLYDQVCVLFYVTYCVRVHHKINLKHNIFNNFYQYFYISLTSCSPVHTCLRFSGFTRSKLQSACKVSNSVVTRCDFNSLMHFLYSLTSQIAHIAPTFIKHKFNKIISYQPLIIIFIKT